MDETSITTVGLLHVSVDVSQSRLTAQFDNILSRLAKLENLSGPMTNVYNNSHILNNNVTTQGVSSGNMEGEQKSSEDIDSAEKLRVNAGSSIVGQLDTNAPIMLHDGKPMSLQEIQSGTVTDMNDKNDKLVVILDALDARQNGVEETVSHIDDNLSTQFTTAMEETNVISEKVQEAIESKLNIVSEKVLVMAKKTDEDVAQLNDRLEAVVERLERKERKLHEDISSQNDSSVHIDDWQRLQKTVVQHGLQIDLFLRKYNEEQRLSQERVAQLETRLDEHEKYTEEQLDALKQQVQQCQTMTMTLNDSNRALTSQFLGLDGEVRQHATQLSGAVSRLQLRLVDLAAMYSSSAENSVVTAGSETEMSLYKKGADAPVLRDIRTAMSGQSQRVENTETALLSIGKYVRDQQERSDRMYTGSMKAVREYVEQGAVKLQQDNTKTQSKLKNNLDRLKSDLQYVLHESTDVSGNATGNVTAVGKVKCLTCDQNVPTVTGGVGVLAQYSMMNKSDKVGLQGKLNQTISNAQEKTWNCNVQIDPQSGTTVNTMSNDVTTIVANENNANNTAAVVPTTSGDADTNTPINDTPLTMTDLGNIAIEHTTHRSSNSQPIHADETLTTKLRINRGEAVTLEGSDGHVYRGRANTRVMLTNDVAPANRFHVSYQDKDSGLTDLAMLHSNNTNATSNMMHARPQTQKISKRTKLRAYNSNASLTNNTGGWSGLALVSTSLGTSSSRPSTMQTKRPTQPDTEEKSTNSDTSTSNNDTIQFEGILETVQGGQAEEE